MGLRRKPFRVYAVRACWVFFLYINFFVVFFFPRTEHTRTMATLNRCAHVAAPRVGTASGAGGGVEEKRGDLLPAIIERQRF